MEPSSVGHLNAERTGLGLFNLETRISLRLMDDRMVFHAEIHVITANLKWFISNTRPNILMDSKLAIWTKTAKMVKPRTVVKHPLSECNNAHHCGTMFSCPR